jgi:hypothetical protein
MRNTWTGRALAAVRQAIALAEWRGGSEHAKLLREYLGWRKVRER